MGDKVAAEELARSLFADETVNVYAIMDGASVGGLRGKMWELDQDSVCLFPGELEPDMAEVAPYLVPLKRGEKFTTWLLAEGWGRHWGVFASSAADLRTLRGHFRSLVNVHDEEGRAMRLRFYDPRVLPGFLATCDPGQIQEAFGPVSAFWMEAKDPATMLCLRCDGGVLKTSEIRLGKAAGRKAGPAGQ
jgi:hypothetical protein